ncbi:polyadenylate-binding protein, cytoplasmic and nuclear [Trichomonascus vanleenenianus]|uniref:polyadenylate-binding protein, cytoplasmic and nuclear n=1 Tax=Trichomonascus vanleenenianus TaxID=2268995 RepID=UPI003EC9938A
MSHEEERKPEEECSLYVGDLDAGVTEAHLFQLFSQFGQIKSIRVVKDSMTRRSLGYAFVNYLSPGDAKRALADPAARVLDGRPLRVMPFQRDPALRNHNSSGNIFIKNLDASIDREALHETFSAFGKIISCKVAYDEYGMPRGFGYVLFEDPRAADEAIEQMDGVLMNDRQVSVSHHITKRERQHRLEEMRANYTNLYIKNIDQSVTEGEFRALFEQHGAIASMSLPLTAEGLSRGFGFVNYESHEDAVKAIEALRGYELHGKRLYVSRAQKKYERLEELRQQEQARLASKFLNTNLYVKYLDESIDDDRLKEAFAPFGTITSARIMTDDSGRSRGYGFVCYATPQEAQAAIAAMHESELAGKQIYVNLAQRKDKRGPPPMGGVGSAAAAAAAAAQMGMGMPGGPANKFYRVPQFPFVPPPPPPGANMPPPGVVPPSPGMGFPMPPFMPQQLYYPMPGAQQFYRPGASSTKKPASASPKTKKPGKKKMNKNQPPFGSTLSAAVASASTPEAEKQVIGEALYPKVSAHRLVKKDDELAGKITGMLLDHDTQALLTWVDDDEILDRHITEAYNAYKEYLNSQ